MPRAASQRKAQASWLLRLTLGIAIIAILVRWKGAGVSAALAHASMTHLLAAVGLYLASQLISAFKWKLLLGAALQAQASNDEARITPVRTAPTLGECYRFYLIGMFCNLWLPTSVGGDAVRAALAGRRWGNLSLSASSILVERITGLIALLAIGAGGWLFWWPRNSGAEISGGASGQVLRLALCALLAAGVLGAALLALRRLAFHLEENSSSKFIAKWAKVHRALDLFASPKLRLALLQAAALSFLFQSTQIGLNLFLARAVALDLAPGIFVWLVPSLGIASMIPLGIGGLGVREGAAITLLQGTLPSAIAPAATTILAWSLLWQATLWLAGLPGAAAYFTQKEKRAP